MSIINVNNNNMDSHHKKLQYNNRWRDFGQCFYDYMYQNFMEWPVTSLQWGNILGSDSEQVTQRLYFSCRTDGIYNPANQTWQNTPNYIIMSTVELPTQDHYFINELKSLFNHDAAKKHPNMKIKNIITHPGEIIVIRASPANKKILASKSDCNEVFLWTSDKYKLNTNASFTNSPDVVLNTTKSQRPNYAIKFAPSLMRLITASGPKIEVFDLDAGPPTKRELGSVMNSNSMKPISVLEGHEGVEDLAFKNNEVWVSGGQDKEIAIWDYRMKMNTYKLSGIHKHDINCLSVRDNYILSGGEEGRVNIIDDRVYKILYTKETDKPVKSIGFNPHSKIFAVGNDLLSIYSLDQIEQTKSFEPKFVHHGIKYFIHHAFDWNQDMPMSIATTCQELDLENPAHGGQIHFFKPSDIFFDSQEDALRRIKEAYGSLSKEQRAKIDKFVQ